MCVGAARPGDGTAPATATGKVETMRRMACLLGMLTCAACGDAGEAPAAIAEVIDSAGVRIVTSEPGDAVFAEVAEEPTLSLGALDGPEELLFGQIASVARDDEGNLVVADNGAGEIRVFGTGGGHLRSFGGRGGGPGSFSRWSEPGRLPAEASLRWTGSSSASLDSIPRGR